MHTQTHRQTDRHTDTRRIALISVTLSDLQLVLKSLACDFKNCCAAVSTVFQQTLRVARSFCSAIAVLPVSANSTTLLCCIFTVTAIA